MTAPRFGGAALTRAVVAVCLLAVLAPAGASASLRFRGTGFYWGDPQPQGEALNAIDFAGRRGYAIASWDDSGAGVAPDSALLRTDDGGQTWRDASAGPLGPLDEVHAVGERTVIAAGCKAFRADDPEAALRQLAVPGAGPGRCLRSVAFPSPDIGYVLQRGGEVVRTSDGGATFGRVASVPGATGRTATMQLLFVSAEAGLATREGVIYRTEDGARTWSKAADETSPVRDLFFVNEQVGYAVGPAGLFLRTADGGRSWQRRTLGVESGRDLGAVACSDASTCLIVAVDEYGFGDRLLRTRDAGFNADELRSPTRPYIADLLFLGPRRVFAVGGGLLISENSGDDFAPLGRSLDAQIGRLRAVGSNFVYGFSHSTLARSADGGRSWTGLPLGDSRRAGEPVDVHFVDPRRGYMLRSAYVSRRRRRTTVVRTLDGGATWTRRITSTRIGSSTALLAVGPNRVVLGGQSGLRLSTDGGRRFRRARGRAAGRPIEGLDAADGAAFAAGKRSLAVSRDRGRSWRRVPLPSHGATVRAVDFLDRLSGYLVTRRGRVYKTADGGRVWRMLRLPSGVHAASGLSFSDARHGWVNISFADSFDREDYSPGRGALLRTDDGGRTWTWQALRDDPVTGLVSTGPSTGVVAIAHALLFTTSGGRSRPIG